MLINVDDQRCFNVALTLICLLGVSLKYGPKILSATIVFNNLRPASTDVNQNCDEINCEQFAKSFTE